MTTGRASNGACELHYDTFGDPADPTLLLVNGLGSQCTNYKDAWCEMFAARGFQVIRFDNRDVGLSTSFAGAPVDDTGACYRLSDMAGDAFAVLDANGVQRAHVMGLSMGGMIVQTMAIEHPERILSMTSVMSNTGEPEYMRSSPEALALLTGPPPTDRDSAIERYVAGMRAYGSTFDDDEARWRADVHPGRHGPPVLRRRRIRVPGRRAAGARRAHARHPRLGRHPDRPDRRPAHGRADPGCPVRAHRGHGPRLPTGDLGALGRPRHRVRHGVRLDRSVTAADVAFLGLRIPEGGGPAILPVTTTLCTPFGWLYGGSGVAACSVAAEAATGKPLVWITTQYVANARPGETVELAVDVVVEGHSTSQTHVHGTVEGRTVLHATTAHTDRPTGELHWWGEMPEVSAPEDATPFALPFEHVSDDSFVHRMDRYLVPEMAELAAQGRAAMWVRVPGWPIGSPASQGFVADIIPLVLGLALGRPPGGTSLDNTVRIVQEEPTDDWILLDIEAEGMHRSIGCGRVRLWRRDGTLIGVGTQSAIIRTSHHTPLAQ
jgi:acyl-CoA thioesterase-2